MKEYSRNRRTSPFKTVSSQIVWSSPWYNVRQDQIILPDGSPGVYNVVQHSGAVWVIPVTSAGEIALLYHYRHTVGDWCWEVPSGGLNNGMTRAAAVRAELLEEVGGTAAAIEYSGHFYTSNGISNEVAHIYIALDVELGQTSHEPAEVMEVHRIPIVEVLKMAHANKISDGPSALALLLCEKRLLALVNSNH
jgi:ADP-ribose pyrophosphatase